MQNEAMGRCLTLGIIIPYALMTATTVVAKGEKKEGGVLKGAGDMRRDAGGPVGLRADRWW